MEDGLAAALADVVRRVDAGEVVTRRGLRERYPDCADALWEMLEIEGLLAEPPPPLHRLGEYRIEREIGRGSMGVVYLAHPDGTDADPVALKVIRPEVVKNPAVRRRVLREAELGLAVRHPNVVRTLGACTDPDDDAHVYLVLEYVEGQTLRELIDEVGRVPEPLCRHIGREVARGLGAVHAVGAVHRDLKPSNVLITADEQIKVMDLGIALLVREGLRLSRDGQFVGSPLYAAPEQIRCDDAEIGPRSDLYALGLLLHELVTGRHYLAEPSLERLRRTVSPFLAAVVTTLVAHDPANRFESAQALLTALDEGTSGAWWSEHGVRGAAGGPRLIHAPSHTRMFGRDEPMEHLAGRLAAACEGAGCTVLVEGEAGIGKSRLLAEFLGRVARDTPEVQVLVGGHGPGEDAASDGGFVRAIREPLAREDVDAFLSDALDEVPGLVPAFRALLAGVPIPASASAIGTDAFATGIIHVVRRLARVAPVVLVVEDLHFASARVRSVFLLVARALGGHRVLLVGSIRSGGPSSWLAEIERLPASSRLRLSRLGPKHLGALISDTLGSAWLARQLAFEIGHKSDGNPFFALEILRALREGELLRRRGDGTWESTATLREIKVPSSVHEILEARLAELDDGDRELLDVASCCGHEFDPTLVADALGIGPVQVLQRFARIQQRLRLVHSVESTFYFDHHQLQEVLYDHLPDPLRERYHFALGVALETRAGNATDVDDEAAVRLCDHFVRAGEFSRAGPYALAAARCHKRADRNDAICALLEPLLASGAIVDDGLLADLLIRLVGAMVFVRRSEEIEDLTKRALRSADVSGDSALRIRALMASGIALSLAGRRREAIAVLQEALVLASATDDGLLRTHINGILGRELAGVEEWELARCAIEDGLEEVRKCGHPTDRISVLANLGIVYQRLGRLDESRRCTEEAYDLARRNGCRSLAVRTRSNLAGLLFTDGEFDAARECLEQVYESALEIGDRHAESVAVFLLELVAIALGLLSDALAWSAVHMRIGAEMGPHEAESAHGGRSDVLTLLGRQDDARADAERAIALCEQCDKTASVPGRLLTLAVLDQDAGDSTSAEKRLLRAVELAGNCGEGSTCALATAYLGGLLLDGPRRCEARGVLDLALRRAQDVGNHAADAQLLAMAWITVLDPSTWAGAERTFQAVEHRANMWERMHARFILWHGTGDPTHLDAAHGLLQFLIEHAPPQYHQSMSRNVPLHRDILADWAEARADRTAT